MAIESNASSWSRDLPKLEASFQICTDLSFEPEMIEPRGEIFTEFTHPRCLSYGRGKKNTRAQPLQKPHLCMANESSILDVPHGEVMIVGTRHQEVADAVERVHEPSVQLQRADLCVCVSESVSLGMLTRCIMYCYSYSCGYN